MPLDTLSGPAATNGFNALLVSAFVGLSCIALGSYSFYNTWTFERHSERTTGTVITVHRRAGSKSVSYAPEVTFTTADKKTITFINPIYESAFRYKTGDAVTVYYPPTRPENARVPIPYNGLPTVSFLMGLFFLSIALLGIRQKITK